ncbi:hypothetical protein C0J52_09975, partial [Blattella germanica]
TEVTDDELVTPGTRVTSDAHCCRRYGSCDCKVVDAKILKERLIQIPDLKNTYILPNVYVNFRSYTMHKEVGQTSREPWELFVPTELEIPFEVCVDLHELQMRSRSLVLQIANVFSGQWRVKDMDNQVFNFATHILTHYGLNLDSKILAATAKRSTLVNNAIPSLTSDCEPRMLQTPPSNESGAYKWIFESASKTRELPAVSWRAYLLHSTCLSHRSSWFFLAVVSARSLACRMRCSSRRTSRCSGVSMALARRALIVLTVMFPIGFRLLFGIFTFVQEINNRHK